MHLTLVRVQLGSIIRTSANVRARGGMEANSHLSTGEAAALLGISVDAVRRLVRTDQLAAVVVAGNIRIARHAVEQRLAAATGSPTNATAPDPLLQAVERILGASVDDLPLLLDPAWLAPRLGMTPRSVRAAMAKGDIPSVRVGTRYRCPTIALITWLTRASSAA
jgi:excisionase family DNA binding protein